MKTKSFFFSNKQVSVGVVGRGQSPRGLALGVMEDSAEVSGVGWFVDTKGSKKRKRGKSSESSDGVSVEPMGTTSGRNVKDEVEEKLEEILFGRQPFQPKVLEADLETESEASEAEEVWFAPCVSEHNQLHHKMMS